MKKEGFSKKQVEQRSTRRRRTMSAVVSITRCSDARKQGKLLPTKPLKSLLEFSPAEIRRIQELENRCSGADEFPVLWDDEEDNG